ncbi:hypothetical protein MJI20_31375, partial [Salmonella enterica subsp. enterica serovar Anatum]|nr:hypothetical protein [Salmonella enterica subsp. enterica serovar Anatum]
TLLKMVASLISPDIGVILFEGQDITTLSPEDYRQQVSYCAQTLRSEIDLADIDYIIINHAEEDHAGALTELMAQIPDTPIYCTA